MKNKSLINRKTINSSEADSQLVTTYQLSPIKPNNSGKGKQKSFSKGAVEESSTQLAHLPIEADYIKDS